MGLVSVQFAPVELVELFADVALADPISFILVISGAFLVGVPSLLLGYLSLRGVIAWVSGPPGQGPPQQAR